MNYPRIFERVYLRPLSVTAERFAAIHSILLPRLRGERPLLLPDEITALAPRAEMPGQTPARPAQNPARNSIGQRRQSLSPDASGRLYTMPAQGVAAVPVYGTLGKNLDMIDMMCGGCDYDAISTAFRQAMADPSCDTVILDFDSPGGEVGGNAELAATIRSAVENDEKNVIAFCDATMASAAYFLGSQCNEVYCTPSAGVGAIGCFIAYLDKSVAAQLKGVSVEVIKSGEYKGLGVDGTSLSDAHRAYLQKMVDDNHAVFASAVTAARPDVKPESMQGQVIQGRAAVAAGLADGVLNNFDELLELVAAARNF